MRGITTTRMMGVGSSSIAAGTKFRRNSTANNNSNKAKWVLICACLICVVSVTIILPIVIMEGRVISSSSLSATTTTTGNTNTNNRVSVHHALLQGGGGVAIKSDASVTKEAVVAQPPKLDADGKRITKDGRHIANIEIKDLDTTLDRRMQEMPVARGVSGSPISQTPALVDAKRAHIDCTVNVDSLAYWNDPIGTRDQQFQSPFSVYNENINNAYHDEKYISFAPDNGGWNNVRMSMEIIFVIAAATGRTLVLPPKEPLYLLHHDTATRHRGFADFFPIHTTQFQSRVKVISFEAFLQKEGSRADSPLAPRSAEELKAVTAAADHCDNRAQSEINCKAVYGYLQSVGYCPDISAVHTCLIFDESMYHGVNVTEDVADHLQTVCGPHRKHTFWDQDIQQHKLIHFRASDREYRLLAHFYGMIYFTNPAIGNYYKRFVRDFLHYHDEIYCAAGKIVKAVQAEGIQNGFTVDKEGAGAYSALHVRRGDLQYKKVKIPASEWYENTKEVWLPKEILYIATDERDKSFFDDLAKHHELRFLDDYWDLAGLGQIDPNYMGMIDTIVASRGRAFAGTWFSTFSGYINRLRGYHGMSMMDSWYSFLPKKTAVHEWRLVDDFVYAFEWPDGWVGIDTDEFPSKDKF